jgi:hypothetical protein
LDRIRAKPCKIVFKKFTEAEIVNFIRLSEVEYGRMESVTNPDHIRCKHLQTPYGPSTAMNLECAGEEVVGRAILQPRLICLSGKQIPVAFVSDALIHPEFRRPVSNFISLMQSIKIAQDFPLVLHTSNNTTEDIYKKLLRFKWPFSLSAFGFLLNLRKAAFKVLKFDSLLFELFSTPYKYLILLLCKTAAIFFDFKLTTEEPDNTCFDKFCHKEAMKNDCEMVRDTQFLRWRYLQSPLWQAKILYLYKDSLLYGYVVLRNVELEGMKYTVVMDFALNETVSTLQRFYLRCSIIHMALSHGDDMVFTLLNPLSRASKKFIGFPWIKIPERFMPQRTPIFLHINDPSRVTLENLSNIHITLGDLDYF